ncbi:reverse transcriptase [Amycolatopsis antarctica]|uniref:RNA-directed DNA polymerase n=1 Tax=Amycolatopsis antarctica TaxID=1854586 RepID=A0A263D9U9_9PSEU|nr:reverse transcriptase [Amycolatopsis antarctica]
MVELNPSPPFGGERHLARLIADLPPLPAPAPVAPFRITGGTAEPQAGLSVAAREWRWDVPRWNTVGECAEALDLTVGELDWFADRGTWNRRAACPLRHYRYRWIPTSSGGVRLLEQPKPRLAELQRRITRHVLSRLPVHEAAHGFRPGRSAFTCAAPHAGSARLVRFDLEGFFAAVAPGRIRSLLGRAGYPRAVAGALAGVLTTAAPVDVLSAAPRASDDAVRHRLLRGLAAAHLPQGAPSSPAVANAVTAGLDVRLEALARALDARYTRYADDLAFSGDSTLPLHRLLPGVRRIVMDEGFLLRKGKTSVTFAHQRQRVAGLVVNSAPAVPREEYDALRALLHNCLRTGPAAQNVHGHHDFRAHVLGRISWVGATHPGRAGRLRTVFDRISWHETDVTGSRHG